MTGQLERAARTPRAVTAATRYHRHLRTSAAMTSPGVRLVEIADLLGVSRQRAHQIAEEKGFPAPLAEDVGGRVWSRYEVQAWAKRWRGEKPWR
jgi:predicted DNA-binding transcriptional regulator AlpA